MNIAAAALVARCDPTSDTRRNFEIFKKIPHFCGPTRDDVEP